MNAVYWIGQDGNVWYKSSAGVQNLGKPLGNPLEDGVMTSPAGEGSMYFASGSRIEDPALSGKSTSTNTNSGYTAPKKVLDSAQLSSLDALIQSLGTVRDQEIKKAELKRNTSLLEKENEKKGEESKYGSKKLGVLQDFGSAKTDTDLNMRNTLENLVSSLSILGLGGSRALTRQILDAGNQSNRKANATQAQDTMNLANAWDEYLAGNEADVKKINDQYGYEEGEANKNYYTGKQTALYKKGDVYGDADYTNEKNAAMKEGDSLNSLITGSTFLNPSYKGEKRAMKEAKLGDYVQDIAQYDTSGVQGANALALTPVASDGQNAPGNLAVRAMAVNNKDLGIKKKAENDLGYGV